MKHMKKAITLTIGLALATLVGCNLKKLPACDAPEVTALAKQALSSAPAFKGRFMNFQLGIPGETRYRTSPTPKRICRSTLSSTVGNEVLFYSVEWQNQKKGIIWVQIMGPRDDGT